MRHDFLSVDEDRVLLVRDVLLDRHALVLEVAKRLLRLRQFLHQCLDRLAQLVYLIHQSATNTIVS